MTRILFGAVLMLALVVIPICIATILAGELVERATADDPADEPIGYLPADFDTHADQAMAMAYVPLDVSLLPEHERDDVLAWEIEYTNRGRS